MQQFQLKAIHLAVLVSITSVSLNALAAEDTAALPEVQSSAGRIYAGSGNDAARTGSKTDVPLRDVPASVSVVPASLLEEQGVQTMNDALRNVSSLQPQLAGGYGFANNYNSRALSINFLRDDLPDGTTQNGYFHTMYDIERIEVLKGPGSALFGAGGPGGSINVVTKKPQSQYNLEVGTTFGSFGTRNGYIDLTGAITDNVNGRLIIDSEKTNGYRGLGREITEISPSIAFNYAEDKSLLIDVDVRKIKVTPDNYGILFDSKRKIANASDKARYYSPMNYTEQNINRLGITHDWAISNALSMRTALSTQTRELDFIRNAGGNGGNAANQSTGRTLRQQSDDASYVTLQNELTWKVDTGAVKHTVLGGYEYQYTDIDTVRKGYTLPNISNIYAPVVTEKSVNGLAVRATDAFNRKINSDTHSFYLQDQLAFGEQYKLRVGLRNDRISFEDKGTSNFGAPNTYRVVKETSDLTTGSLGGVYQPTKNLAFYTGYNNGKFVNLATEGTIVSAKPESSEQYELGTKSSLFNGLMDLNLAVFKTYRDNYNITLPGATFATPNGKDQSKGVEFDLGLHPMVGLNINTNAVFMDAETKSKSVANNAIFGITNHSIYGTRPTGVSEKIVNVWASYEIQTGDIRGLKFGIGATHKGDAYADNLNLYKIPAYTVYDAAISYAQPKWQAAINLKNITDKTYYVSPSFTGALPGDPRSIYATLRFDFK